MKRLMILTVVAMLAATSLGCCHDNWIRRGSSCNTCPTGGGVYGAPTNVYSGETYMPGPG